MTPPQKRPSHSTRGLRVLVVDDEEVIRDIIRRKLEPEGYEVVTAKDGEEALQAALDWSPDLAILDVIMPKLDGFDLCRRMRESPELAELPVIFLTSRESVEDRIRGFEAGADDYLPKPFDLRELSLRVRALLRRTGPEVEDSDLLRLGGLVLNTKTFVLQVDDKEVLLTPVEHQLVHHLMRHSDEVFSSERLLQEVWGYPRGAGSPDLVRAHVRNVRHKIELDPSNPAHLITVSRHGYAIRG